MKSQKQITDEMTKEEFLKKYQWAPQPASNCHQITWDLIEEMVQTFDDAEFETAKGATLYDINNLLEVIKTDIPDYNFLLNLKQDLENTNL